MKSSTSLGDLAGPAESLGSHGELLAKVLAARSAKPLTVLNS